MNEIEETIRAVKIGKATALFWDNVKGYGGKEAALRALDCYTVEEAVRMLAVVQEVSIFKINGKVVVQ